MARELACEIALPSPIGVPWGKHKYSRKQYLAMCDFPLDISRAEFERRMRIFGGNHFGMSPSIKLHGLEFRAVASLEVETEAAA